MARQHLERSSRLLARAGREHNGVSTSSKVQVTIASRRRAAVLRRHRLPPPRPPGAIAVEMEAAALYADAAARGRDVLCLAHVTNSMATAGDDFEKGEEDGAVDAL
jgi:nucleoside phosphorylase